MAHSVTFGTYILIRKLAVLIAGGHRGGGEEKSAHQMLFSYLLFSFFNNVLHITEWWSFLPKIMVDQTIWGPIWNNSYILLLGIMKLDSFQNIGSDMKRTTIPLIVSSLKLWPLAHCITYGLIPIEHRLLWVDLVEILWVTILATQAAASSESREDAAEAAAPSK
jgi:hypothetical protein